MTWDLNLEPPDEEAKATAKPDAEYDGPDEPTDQEIEAAAARAEDAWLRGRGY